MRFAHQWAVVGVAVTARAEAGAVAEVKVVLIAEVKVVLTNMVAGFVGRPRRPGGAQVRG